MLACQRRAAHQRVGRRPMVLPRGQAHVGEPTGSFSSLRTREQLGSLADYPAHTVGSRGRTGDWTSLIPTLACSVSLWA